MTSTTLTSSLTADLTMDESLAVYDLVVAENNTTTMRRLCLEDLFFLLVVVCRRKDMINEWLYARVREVEKDRDGFIDIWSREHYKSSVITFGMTVQDILINPDITVGIFSHTRPIAKAFLTQIKRELESNEMLKTLFPEVLYAEPWKESVKWSIDDGIIVKRSGNPKESTVEAWGMVDGMPTSKHYNLMVFDDVVTKESVGTPDQIAKTTEAWALSLNLSSGEDGRKRYVGTRYHTLDTYATIIERKAATPRIYPATEDGTFTGKAVLWTQETFEQKVNEMGRPVSASQLLCDPLSDDAMGFMREWIQYYNVLKGTTRWNFYIVVDAASEKKKSSDYTVIAVIGLGPDKNYYLVDAVRDRMNLTERTKKLFAFVRKWKPTRVGYEKYGMQSDIEHIKYVQEIEGYRFNIIEMSGQMPKNDRIRRLIPIFEQGRFYFPQKMLFTGYDGKVHDFVSEFINDEFVTFPISKHDDMCDCLARITDDDLNAVFPKEIQISTNQFPTREYDPLIGSGYMTQQEYHPLVIR